MHQKRWQTATKSVIITPIWDILEEIAPFQTNKLTNLFNSGKNKEKDKIEDILIIETNFTHNYVYQIESISLQSEI